MITLIKDESHKGYYKDEDDNLYVFRFGGRPIKVDSYRDDLPNEKITSEKIIINENDIEFDKLNDESEEHNSKLDNKYTNYDNTSRDGNEQREYYDKIGKEKFDTPSNMYLDKYIKYGQQKIDDSDIKLLSSNMKELATPAKEDFIVYHGKAANDTIDNRSILSTTLNKQVAKSYAKFDDNNVVEIRINKDAPIISTYNAKDLSDEEHHHFKNQSEIVLLPTLGNLIEIAPGVYEFKKNEQ